MRFDYREFIRELLGSTDTLIELDAALEDHLVEAYGFSRLEAGTEVDRLLPKVKDAIGEYLADLGSRGVTKPYVFDVDELDSPVLVRYSESTGPSEGKIVERVLQHKAEVLAALGRLRCTEFEYLCGKLVEIWGAERDRVYVTRPTREGGMDFCAALPTRLPNTSLDRRIRYRILGQARFRASGPIERKEIDAFLGRLKRARDCHFDDFLDMPEWFIGGHEPILGLFVTNSRFRRGHREYAQEENIILYDGDQLVEDLIRSEHWARWQEPLGVFNPDKLIQWIRDG